jgi:hypothetical protein
MLHLNARRKVHVYTAAVSSSVSLSIRTVHSALAATKFGDTVVDIAKDSVVPLASAPECDHERDMTLSVGDHYLIIRFPDEMKAAAKSGANREDAAKLVAGRISPPSTRSPKHC